MNRSWIPTALAMFTFAGCKSVYTELEVPAAPEEVWAVLQDVDAYDEWNPYHVSVEGRVAEGETLRVHIEKPNGNRVDLEPKVLRVKPGTELTWGGGVPLLFTGEHTFLLQPTKRGTTLLVHKEQFRGVFVPFAELESIEEGYRSMNRALARRVVEAQGARRREEPVDGTDVVASR